VKILFVGVFDAVGKSTNTSQLMAFKEIGCEVVGYNYRLKAHLIGNKRRDEELIKILQDRHFDLVVFSKCNVLGSEVFRKATAKTKTCFWFMDAKCNYDQEMRDKTSLVTYGCFDKKNVLEEALKINKNSFYVCEGYDQAVDKRPDVEKEYDVTFIGSVYGNRIDYTKNSKYKINVVSDAYGPKHAMTVGKSKINLNFCTSDGASDRVYKIMAAGGFLMTDDWTGRDTDFIEGEDLIIFKDIDDLNEKIKYYLENSEERQAIATSGHQKVQRFNRVGWATKIVELSRGVIKND